MAEQDATRADAEALDWLVALQEDPQDADVQARFEAWRASDPLCAQAWAEAAGVYGAIGLTPPAHAERWAGLPGHAGADIAGARRARPVRLRGASRLVPRHLVGRLAASVAAVLVVALVAPGVLVGLRADYATGVGEVRQVRLEDGSLVSLGPDTAVSVDYADHRQVRLLKGQAWFDVRHNPQRPFQVRARDVETIVLGTAFEVDTAADHATVAVQRGLVGVTALHGPSRPMEPTPAGRAVTVSRDGVLTRAPIASDRVAAWRDGQLVVENEAIGEVVGALKPWSRDLILVRGAGLAGKRVTGVYDLRDPDAVVEALAVAYDLKTTRITPWILVLSER